MGSSLSAVNRVLPSKVNGDLSRQASVFRKEASPEQVKLTQLALTIATCGDPTESNLPVRDRLLSSPPPTLDKPKISLGEISGYQPSQIILEIKQITMKVARNSFADTWSNMNPAQRQDAISGVIGLLHEENNSFNQHEIYEYLESGIMPSGILGQKLKKELEQKIVPSLFQKYIFTLRNANQQQEPASGNPIVKPLDRCVEKINHFIKAIKEKISVFIHIKKK